MSAVKGYALIRQVADATELKYRPDGNTATVALFHSTGQAKLARTFGLGSGVVVAFTTRGSWQASYTQRPTSSQTRLVKDCLA